MYCSCQTEEEDDEEDDCVREEDMIDRRCDRRCDVLFLLVDFALSFIYVDICPTLGIYGANMIYA